MQSEPPSNRRALESIQEEMEALNREKSAIDEDAKRGEARAGVLKKAREEGDEALLKVCIALLIVES